MKKNSNKSFLTGFDAKDIDALFVAGFRGSLRDDMKIIRFGSGLIKQKILLNCKEFDELLKKYKLSRSDAKELMIEVLDTVKAIALRSKESQIQELSNE